MGFGPTFNTSWAQKMSTLDLATARASIKALHVFEGLAGHLSMTLLHVGGLLLRNGAQDGIPKIGEEGWDIERDRNRL